MFGIPNTTSSGFSFGASSGGLSGANPGSFSFGANPGVNAGTATTGGFGGFSLGGSGGMAPASTTQQTGGFNFGAVGTKSAAAPTGGFGNFSFGATQQTQAPQTSTVGGFTTGTVANSGGVGLPLGTATTGSTVFGSLRPAAPATLPASVSGGLTGFGPATTKGVSGSLLGGLLTSTTSVPATTTSIAPTGGFSFGSTATTTAGGSSFGFGGAPSTAAAPVVTTASQGFGFGTPSQQPATSAPTLATGLSLGSVFSPATTSTAAVAITSAATSLVPVSGASLPGTKQMTFRQLEETINKWTTELEEQEKYFLDQATQVNAWDRIVMENGEKIVQLNKDVEKVKLDQQKLDHELDFIHSQQKELEDILTPLEKALDSSPAISYQQHADIEREHTYILTESLDAQLKRMGQDLKEIIERLNSNNTSPDSNDPVQQITKILNAHVVSLMWVDRNTANLQRRVEEISKQMDVDKREQERNFRLAYS